MAGLAKLGNAHILSKIIRIRNPRRIISAVAPGKTAACPVRPPASRRSAARSASSYACSRRRRPSGADLGRSDQPCARNSPSTEDAASATVLSTGSHGRLILAMVLKT